MALLWQKQSDGCHYEVRSAGQSVRLYSNGVFHSQWNPDRVFGDAVWDLLGLAAFPVAAALQGKRPMRVLVLGVGGGAVIRQLLALFDVGHVQGVDLDPTHLAIARRWFGLNRYRKVKLTAADAVEWVANYKGPKFDLVIDDLFGHSEEELGRSVAFDGLWAVRLSKLMAEGGALVINNANRAEFNAARSVAANYSLGVELTHPRYENLILTLFGEAKSVKTAHIDRRRWRQSWSGSMLQLLESAGLPAAQCRLGLGYMERAKRVRL